jgi:hypothetical protein
MIFIMVDVIGMGQTYEAFSILLLLFLFFILVSKLKPYKIDYINTVEYYSELA